jgi:hypothetical protein
MKSADKYVSCVLWLYPSSYDSPYLCLLLPCLLSAPNKQRKRKRSLFFSVLSVLSANPRRFTRKKTYSFPPFATALDVTEWCTQVSLLHTYTTERRASDTLDSYCTTAELDVAENRILSQGVEQHFLVCPKCNLVITPTEPLSIINFSLLSFPRPL